MAAAEFIFSVPGVVAQPPFSMSARWSHEAAFLNSISFAVELACCWNFSTQIGASTLTTALSARSAAMRSAVLPRVQPIDEKPITDIATAPETPPQSAGFELGRARDGLVLHLSETMAVSALELARKVDLSVAEVVGRLTSLELEGAVRRHGSGYLRALRRGK